MIGLAARATITGLPHFAPGMQTLSAQAMNRHVAITRAVALAVQQREPNLAPPVRGGGSGDVKTVKIISVAALTFSCKDTDDAGAEIGAAFDVYPRVVGNGYEASYNLTATTGTVVLEKFTAGQFLDIFATQKQLRRAAGVVPLRWWTAGEFHLSSCTVAATALEDEATEAAA